MTEHFRRRPQQQTNKSWQIQPQMS
uniref:Uncharacterized protein n=1 Tax=Arundo donax TaxID=35708 RepID=A0A0A8Y4C6_ARUDO